jgi:hypothetical protein
MMRPAGLRRRPVTCVLASCATTVVLLAGCASSASSHHGTAAIRHQPTQRAHLASEASIIARAFSSPTQRRDAAGTVWLCRPGLSGDPCAGSLQITSVSARGTKHVLPVKPVASPKADCVYIYPTETTANSDLQIQGSEIETAKLQAAQFSQDCSVWAPMYHQLTVHQLFHPVGSDAVALETAQASALAGFEDYLTHYNDGRPFVLLGHSQGAAMVIKVLEETVDRSALLRKHFVSAVILGGNVTVPPGRLVGGSFSHLPACTKSTETGCILAYSSFLATPPAASFFGRAGAGVSFMSGEHATKLQVLCTNAAKFSGTGALSPIFQSGMGAKTPYVTYPGLYTGTCENRGGTSWLAVHVVGTSADHRPRVSQVLGPDWGLHLFDFNMELGNLVQVVGEQIAAFHA